MRCTVILPGALTFRSFSNIMQVDEQTDVDFLSKGNWRKEGDELVSSVEVSKHLQTEEYRVLSSECKECVSVYVFAKCNDFVHTRSSSRSERAILANIVSPCRGFVYLTQAAPLIQMLRASRNAAVNVGGYL